MERNGDAMTVLSYVHVHYLIAGLNFALGLNRLGKISNTRPSASGT